MSKDEALKTALEALENHCGNYKLDDAGCKRWNKAVVAIKEALAKVEQISSQEPTIKQGWDVDTLLDKPEQRPVFLIYDDAGGWIESNEREYRKTDEVHRWLLYTTPLKRPWVGLTDEFCITNMFDIGHYSLQIVFKSRKNADEFKASLKEKNT